MWRMLLWAVSLCFIEIDFWSSHGEEAGSKASSVKKEIRSVLQCSWPEIMESLKRNSIL